MRAFISTLLVTALLLGSLLPGVQAQETEKDKRMKKRIDRYVDRLTKKQGTEFWNIVLQIEALGEEAVPQLEATSKNEDLAEVARLGLAKALATLDSYDRAIEMMLALVNKGKDKQIRISAAEMLGTYGAADLEKDIEKALSDTFDPRLRIALSKALFQACGSTKGRLQLKSLLKSDNVKTQYEAALALAELGDIESARLVLTQLEKEPSPRGRLAASLLRQHMLNKRIEKVLTGVGMPKKAPTTKPQDPLIEEMIKKIQEYHVNGDRFSRKQLIELAVKGMARGLDVHSVYWTPKEWKDFIKSITGDYAGIGVYVGFRSGTFTVISPIYSGPAYKAGLRSRDQILDVEGWSTRDQPIEEIIKRIQGVPGTAVKLKVYREGWEKARVIAVLRQKIQVKSCKYKLLPGKIGYFRLTQFGSKTAEELEDAIKDLKGQGMKGMILDLRNNGGGYMVAATKIADMFLDEGNMIVYSKGRNEILAPKREHFATKYQVYLKGPMSVLINGSTASASEIVSGALQHHKRAVLIGERSFGKGTVQQPMQLDSEKDARLKLTIARYYLPSGKSIDTLRNADQSIQQKGGIKPDTELRGKRVASWKNEEYMRIREKSAFKTYIKTHYEKHKKLFGELAVNDRRDFSRYPEFEKWYKSLDTKADRQDVREWLRDFVRIRAADDRGAEFVHDLLEDRQLQKAVLMMCDEIGADPKKLEKFSSFVDAFKKGKEKK